MANSRKEKSEVVKNTDLGALILFFIVIGVGTLAYFAPELGDRWTKVLEIVGAPFSLGLGFFAFEKASDMIIEYRKNVGTNEEPRD
ncbi:hypothetical protein [Streptococcus iners]|uniref:Uncharacterized protein n=1 Tax=Streptococcus iners TaxID=3028084 RepID=A0AA96VNB6_9STRE|nr:hypothetical protein [Streptococcus sp. 29887]MCK4026727.1 hypothetical protein [Streptococcus suis]WNY52212.1 hypothetical protein PW252_11235 [Streptococcus sp. 29887]